MLIITDRASLVSALSNTDLDADLRALLGLRAWELHVEQGRPLGLGFRLVAVMGGDTPEVINTALGFAFTEDLAENCSYDWVEDHGLFFEVAYGQEGEPFTRVFVENGPGIELGVHLCLMWAAGEGGSL